MCEILLHEFRQGAIGNITLERPDMIEKELIALDKKIVDKQKQKDERKKK